MSLMLKRGVEAIVGAALVVALLAVLPAVAEAQSKATTPQEGAQSANGYAERSVVVAAGDTLWSISARRLGPDSTPQQVAKGVEQIYALNKDQIGPDPNLIFAGQRLSLPETDGGALAHPIHAKATGTPPSARREDTGTAPTAAVTSTESGQEADASAATVRGETSEASRTITAGQAAANKPIPKASEDAARPVSVEKQARSEDSPLASLLRSVSSVVSSTPSAVGDVPTRVRAAVAGASRTTQGWMVLVLTAVVGALMAWKLFMRRTTRWEAERWGSPYGYYSRGRHTTYLGNLAMHTVERDETGQRTPYGNPAPPVPGGLEGSSTNGSEATGSEANGAETKRPKVVRHPLAGGAPRRSRAKLRRLGGAAARSAGRSVVRNGLVTGITRAEVHHALRIPPNGGIQAVRRRVGRRG